MTYCPVHGRPDEGADWPCLFDSGDLCPHLADDLERACARVDEGDYWKVVGHDVDGSLVFEEYKGSVPTGVVRRVPS